jgi:hypothetical protein
VDESDYFARWTRRRRKLVRTSLGWGVSLALHAALLGAFVGARRRATEPLPVPTMVAGLRESGGALSKLALRRDLQEKRVELVRRARVALKKNDLALGVFLLEANAIDAEEEGKSVDLEAARRLYGDRVKALRARVEAPDAPALEEIVPLVFEDLSYSGIPGGRMADTLLERSGSCEPLSHLIAAALYDAGVRKRSFLRFYGGKVAGISHLAPLLVTFDESGKPSFAHDLVTGAAGPADGALFPAAELVEVYARAHGVDLRDPTENPFAEGEVVRSRRHTVDPKAGPFSLASVPRTRTLSSGYPVNDDKFVGALPLFSERAVRAPAPADASEGGFSSPPAPCSVYVHIAWLDPPHVRTGSSGEAWVDLVRLPSRETLDRLATTIQTVEASEPRASLAQELATTTCLTALYDRAALLFSLSGKTDVSERAARSANAARREGEAALTKLAALAPGERIATLVELDEATMGRAWTLMFLPGAEPALTEYAREGPTAFRRVLPLVALLVHPSTRDRAARLAESLPVADWIDVMAELVHAHDNARPWSVIHPLGFEADLVSDARFLRTYKVFARVAWRLWEAGSPPEDVVGELVAEGRAQALSNEELAMIARYYLKNYVLIETSREGGRERIGRAAAALEAARLPGLSALESPPPAR